VNEHPVCLVTGAFGAVGTAVAARLAAQGARLVLVDAAQAPPEPLAAIDTALRLGGVDLTDAIQADNAVQRAASQWGRLDGVVNIAGGFRWESIAEGSAQTWDLMFAMNLKTALHTCRSALPWLKARGGRIVNVGAAAAGKAGAGMGAYAASKSAVLRLTEALAEETKDHGINVNAVLPSIVDTPANRRDMPEADHSRWVAPDALADVVAFLLGNGARAITGAGIPVTGRS
jgi:NAD(P)-dependent dehydrogenase (short-subunit alcohol dehydrogenase family)